MNERAIERKLRKIFEIDTYPRIYLTYGGILHGDALRNFKGALYSALAVVLTKYYHDPFIDEIDKFLGTICFEIIEKKLDEIEDDVLNNIMNEFDKIIEIAKQI